MVQHYVWYFSKITGNVYNMDSSHIQNEIMILISTNKSMETCQENKTEIKEKWLSCCVFFVFLSVLGSMYFDTTKAFREGELFLDIMTQQPPMSCHVRTNTYKSHRVMSCQDTYKSHRVMSGQTLINHTGSCHVRTNTYKSHWVMSCQDKHKSHRVMSCQDKHL